MEGVDYISSSSVQRKKFCHGKNGVKSRSDTSINASDGQGQSVRYKLPEQAYDPVIELSSGESTAVAYVGFSSDQISIPELTDYLSRVVEPMFSSINGVAKYKVFGGQQQPCAYG